MLRWNKICKARGDDKDDKMVDRKTMTFTKGHACKYHILSKCFQTYNLIFNKSCTQDLRFPQLQFYNAICKKTVANNEIFFSSTYLMDYLIERFSNMYCKMGCKDVRKSRHKNYINVSKIFYSSSIFNTTIMSYQKKNKM